MTDRVLTETQLMETEAFLAKRFDWTPEEWTKLAALTTSHRLLEQQAKELAEQVVWLKDKLSKAVTYD